MSYSFKLLALSLAAFFLPHLVIGLAAAWLTPAAIRRAGRMKPRAAARFLLSLRLFPSAAALFFVAAICIPSYLRFEPAGVEEDIGLACLLAASLSLTVWSISFARAAKALLHSRRYIRTCEKTGRNQHLNGNPALIVTGHTVALAGLLKTKVIVAEEVIRALPPDQLEAALSHERAHAHSRDNLKRLLLLLAPDVLPLFRLGVYQADRAWSKFTEWSADDQSVNGDPARSLSLAAALIQVARMGDTHQPSPLVTSLVAEDLTARVNRLLTTVPEVEHATRWTPTLVTLMVLTAAAIILQPAAHRLLERLIN